MTDIRADVAQVEEIMSLMESADEQAFQRIKTFVLAQLAAPVDMILHCPACGLQHIDAPDERTADWKNEPHRSHLCHGCGHIWRPADVATNGVAAIKTKGKADSEQLAAPEQSTSHQIAVKQGERQPLTTKPVVPQKRKKVDDKPDAYCEANCTRRYHDADCRHHP